MSYPGIYKARCISSNGGSSVDLYVPQLFGDVPITTATFTGAKPAAGSDGWVAFEGADAAYPVWISAAAGSGGTTVTGGGVTVSSNYIWQYDSSATMADPGSGNIRTNTAAGTPATQVAISTTTDRTIGAQDILRSLTSGDLIYFQKETDASSWGRYTISGTPTDNGSWFLLPVTQVEVHGTAVGKNQEVLLRFTYGQGVVGSSGVTTIVGTANQVTASAPTGNVTLSLPQNIHTGATPTFTGLTTKKTTDTNPRIRIDGEGNATWQSPLRTPFVGDHQVGAVGYGHDTQFYLERASNVSAILTLQMNRPGSLPGIEPAITSGNTFPVSGGSVTVADATELPSTTGGPYGLGTAVVELPSFTDTFTRADSATTMGAPWTAIGGNVWGISGNAAYVATGSISAESIVTMDTGAGSHDVSCDLSSTSSPNSHGSGIVINCDGTNQNYICIQFNNSVGNWDVHRRVGGTYTFIHNSGLTSPNITVRAKVQPSGYLYVWFGSRAPIVTNVGTGFLAWKRAGLINIYTAAPSSTMKWDNFNVRTTAPATWTGKTGNTLTGFTCAGLSGTATTNWTVNFADGTAGNLVAAYDGAGAPIWNLRAYGGQHTTDNVTMGGGLGAEVGMSFLSLGARTPPALVLYGDAPPTGSGYDSTAGTFLRRDAAYRILSGGRIFISPSDLRPGGVIGAGTAANPHLGIGTPDTGLFLKSTGATDAMGVAVDGVETVAFANNTTYSSNILFGTGNLYDVGSIFAAARTVHAQTDFWLAGKRIMYSTASPEGVRTAAVGSICMAETGALYLKKTGTGNTGWVVMAEAGAATGFSICTSTTRPSSPSRGWVIYETDTMNTLVYYGATTGWMPPWNMPWGPQYSNYTGTAAPVANSAYTGIGGTGAGSIATVPGRQIEFTWTTLINNTSTTVAKEIHFRAANAAGTVFVQWPGHKLDPSEFHTYTGTGQWTTTGTTFSPRVDYLTVSATTVELADRSFTVKDVGVLPGTTPPSS